MDVFTLALAFAAGLLSFFSPCVLPVLPGFMSVLAGIGAPPAAGGEGAGGAKPAPGGSRLFINSVFFVLGFCVCFALIGLVLQSVLASVGPLARLWLSRVGGLVIIFFGIYTLGWVRVPFLEEEHKVGAVRTRNQYLTAAALGATFAVGWSPCVGAVLGSILTVAAADPGGALLPMLSYSAGLGVPFLLAGALGGRMVEGLRSARAFLPYYRPIAGGLLILVGVLVATQQLTALVDRFAPQALIGLLRGGGI